MRESKNSPSSSAIGHIALASESVACCASDDEPLSIEFKRAKRWSKAVRTSHEGDVQLTLDEEIAQLLWNAFQNCDFHPGIVRSEPA